MAEVQQADLYTQSDGTLLIKNAVTGITVEDDFAFKTNLKETATGLELTVYDGVGAPTVYQIEGGKLQTVMEIKASINGVFNQAITDELAAANHFPKEGEFVKSAASSYLAISVDSDLTNKEYLINFNDLGRPTIKGQISTVDDAALTAEFVKLGRYDWTEKEQIGYLDTTSKVMEVLWAKFDTETGEYTVNCGQLV